MSEIRVSEIRVSKIRVSEIRVSEIRISSNHRELHGAIFAPVKVFNRLCVDPFCRCNAHATQKLVLTGISQAKLAKVITKAETASRQRRYRILGAVSALLAAVTIAVASAAVQGLEQR